MMMMMMMLMTTTMAVVESTMTAINTILRIKTYEEEKEEEHKATANYERYGDITVSATAI